jgi:hypothetical protein
MWQFVPSAVRKRLQQQRQSVQYTTLCLRFQDDRQWGFNEERNVKCFAKRVSMSVSRNVSFWHYVFTETGKQHHFAQNNIKTCSPLDFPQFLQVEKKLRFLINSCLAKFVQKESKQFYGTLLD